MLCPASPVARWHREGFRGCWSRSRRPPGRGCGTVFRMTAVGTVTVLHAFAGGVDGETPESALIQAADGNFYGTTAYGGASDAGTVFRMTPAGTMMVSRKPPTFVGAPTLPFVASKTRTLVNHSGPATACVSFVVKAFNAPRRRRSPWCADVLDGSDRGPGPGPAGPYCRFCSHFGAGEWTRTTDLLIKNYESHRSGPLAMVRRRSPWTDLAGELRFVMFAVVRHRSPKFGRRVAHSYLCGLIVNQELCGVIIRTSTVLAKSRGSAGATPGKRSKASPNRRWD
jgi:uncharacterized repeat protein (TIGR03803 family)